MASHDCALIRILRQKLRIEDKAPMDQVGVLVKVFFSHEHAHEH